MTSTSTHEKIKLKPKGIWRALLHSWLAIFLGGTLPKTFKVVLSNALSYSRLKKKNPKESHITEWSNIQYLGGRKFPLWTLILSLINCCHFWPMNFRHSTKYPLNWQSMTLKHSQQKDNRNYVFQQENVQDTTSGNTSRVLVAQISHKLNLLVCQGWPWTPDLPLKCWNDRCVSLHPASFFIFTCDWTHIHY